MEQSNITGAEKIGLWLDEHSVLWKEKVQTQYEEYDSTICRLKHQTCIREILEVPDPSILIQDYSLWIKEYDDSMNHSGFIADILWLYDIKIEAVPSLKERWLNLAKLLLKQQRIKPDDLKERLEFETLESLKLVNNAANFNKKMIRINTAMLYKQQKFNIMWEENEGYSKLFLDLNAVVQGPCRFSSEIFVDHIKALIGYFDLDPNRVLDLILSVFQENSRAAEFFIQLIKNLHYKKESVQAVVGFRFKQYHVSGSSHFTPTNLFEVVALLIKYDLIVLSSIYPYLFPSDTEALDEYKTYMHKVFEKAKSIGVISLATKTDEIHSADVSAQSTLRKDNAILAISEKAIEEQSLHAEFRFNQKWGLIEGLCKVRCREQVLTMLSQLPLYSACRDGNVAKAICQYIHYSIEPFYRKMLIGQHFKSLTHIEFQPELNITFNAEMIFSSDDLYSHIFPLLRHLGAYLAVDPLLFGKCVRIGRMCLSEIEMNRKRQNKTHESEWLRLISHVLLPSLSLLEPNPGLAEELWQMLKILPCQYRFSLYNDWKNTIYDHFGDLLLARSQVQSDTRKVMRRLSKDNIKQFGRKLGKLAHSNPAIVFFTIIDQIQAYDNMIIPVVDSFKYLTNLSYDVLSFIIIEALSNSEKPRLKEDGTNLSSWLQSLALFCGILYKKYNMELDGILQYVANQLRRGNTFDLVIIKELVQKMSGIDSLEELSESQIASISGGEILRSQSSLIVSSNANSKNVKRSSFRLMKALSENRLAFPLCILIAQQRNNSIFNTDISHLKLIGGLFDQCQETLLQFVDFLSCHLEAKLYDQMFPSVPNLCLDFHLEPELAFCITRQKINNIMAARVQQTGDEPWHPGLKELIDKVPEIVGLKEWSGISPQFYATFWQLSLYDISVPKDRYHSEISRLEGTLLLLSDVKDATGEAVNRKQKEKERIVNMIRQLNSELAKQEENHKSVMKRLETEKDFWFLEAKIRPDINSQLIQYCVFPRCIFSPADAIFSAKFVNLMHSLGALKFSSLSFYDRVVNDIKCTIYSRTQNEANNYARFLSTLLSNITRWHSNIEIYSAEAKGNNLPGFQRKWTASKINRKLNDEDILSYEDFRHVVYKWHVNLFRSFASCLESKEYMQIKNALIILTKISDYFPVVRKMGSALENIMTKIKETDDREDLKVLATRYYAMLQIKKNTWVEEEIFHYVKMAKKTTDSDCMPLAKNGDFASKKSPEELLKKHRDSSVKNPLLEDSKLESVKYESASKVKLSLDTSHEHTGERLSTHQEFKKQKLDESVKQPVKEPLLKNESQSLTGKFSSLVANEKSTNNRAVSRLHTATENATFQQESTKRKRDIDAKADVSSMLRKEVASDKRAKFESVSLSSSSSSKSESKINDGISLKALDVDIKVPIQIKADVVRKQSNLELFNAPPKNENNSRSKDSEVPLAAKSKGLVGAREESMSKPLPESNHDRDKMHGRYQKQDSKSFRVVRNNNDSQTVISGHVSQIPVSSSSSTPKSTTNVDQQPKQLPRSSNEKIASPGHKYKDPHPRSSYRR